MQGAGLNYSEEKHGRTGRPRSSLLKKNLHWSSCPGAVHEVRRGFNPGGQGGLECKHQGAIAELK